MVTNENAPILWGPDGKPISTAGAMVAPHALNFSQILQLPGHLYSFRWDEAMRDNPQNALAMRRDAFYLSLLQERWAPTINLQWQAEVDDDRDPKQKVVRDAVNRLWRETPDKINLVGWLLWAGWYGRSGQQGVWDRQQTGLLGWTAHEPVNGDSIQYQWDGTPCVLVSHRTAQKYQQTDPEAVIRSSDRGAFVLRLYRPEYRKRFVIHQHAREAADYFEGEMSGGAHGVGLRSWLYWSGWMRTEVIGWMVSFMQSTGMMDLLIFNFADGSASGEASAIANAKKISGKLVLLVPRDPREKFPAVEQISMNVAGVQVLRELVSDYYERHAERLVVGQSMSAGADNESGLGGSGRAELAKDTKYQLCKTDAMRLAETLSRDYIAHAVKFNFPWADFPVRLAPVLQDPDEEKKVDAGVKLIQAGVEIEEGEFRKAGGYSDPRPGEKTIGGQKPIPGAPGANPVARPGEEDGADPLDSMFGDEEPEEATSYEWQSHTIKAGPRKGQGAWRHTETGEIRDTKPEERAGKGESGQGGGQAAPGPDATPEEGRAHARSLLTRAKEVPPAMADKVAKFIQAKYEKFSERYGPTGAKAVLAGAILLTPIPLPGTSLLPIAIAEGVRRLYRALKGQKSAVGDGATHYAWVQGTSRTGTITATDGTKKLYGEEAEAALRGQGTQGDTDSDKPAKAKGTAEEVRAASSDLVNEMQSLDEPDPEDPEKPEEVKDPEDPEEPEAVETVSIEGHDTFRGRVPSVHRVTSRPKTKAGREELGRHLKNAWTEARNALTVKYGTAEINDLMTPEEERAEHALFTSLVAVARGDVMSGPKAIGPMTDQQYTAHYATAIRSLDKLRAMAANRSRDRI